MENFKIVNSFTFSMYLDNTVLKWEAQNRNMRKM